MAGKRIIRQKNRLFTVNLPQCEGKSVYGERLKKQKDQELRSWNPYRSKLASAILKGLDLYSLLSVNSTVLYLGAATGTTVSHLSDILCDGNIFAVEHSSIAAKKLVDLANIRSNIFPLFEDANHPERYIRFVPSVDMLYQDISQRNQADIFIRNAKQFLKETGNAIMMIKARSIDVSLPPAKAYEQVKSALEQQGLGVEKQILLSPFEKDHCAFIIKKEKQ